MFEAFVQLLGACPSYAMYVHYYPHVEDWHLHSLYSFQSDLPIYDLWFGMDWWDSSMQDLEDFLDEECIHDYCDGCVTIYQFDGFYVATMYSSSDE